MLITKLKKHLTLIILLFILVMVCVANYVPNTWLTGWDNLHSEFDFALNARRAFNSVWQEYQGLGLLSGMAHAADFFRVIFLWLMSLVIPNQFSRYFYHFLMLFIGALGVYFFSKNIVLAKLTKNKREISLVAATFYLLNFGTVQYFFTPFEPFSTFWGFFPWEIYVLLQYLFSPSRRNLLILAVVNLAASAQAYVQPLFVVYGSVVALLSLGYLRRIWSLAALKTVALAGLVIFLINSYWILPNAYFVFTKVQVTQNSMNNRMNTERFFQWSKSHGTVKDFLLLRNIPYDESATEDNGIDYMLPWRDYFTYPLVEAASIGLFLLGVLGLLLRRKWRSYFLAPFILLMVGLLSQTPFIDLANWALRQLPLVSQILRNPFTKLVVPLIFLISVGIALSLESVIERLKKHFVFSQEVISLFFVLTIYISLPTFSGNLFSGKVRQRIPAEYLALFEYFGQQEKTSRIMNLPQDSFWGWGSYRWGSLGSGFLWYGIEQPIMDRAFDVWSSELEGYYWELVYALRTKNQPLFNQVVDKYSIGYILYDRSYSPSDQLDLRNLRKQQDLLTNSSQYSLVWSQGNLFVYKVNLAQPWLKVQADLPTVKTEPFMHFDRAYLEKGNYINSESAVYLYPNSSFFSSRFASEADFKFLGTGVPKSGAAANLITTRPYEESSYYLNPSQGISGQTFQTQESGTLKTIAKNQSLDTWWSFPEASSSAYLLKITSRTVSGFPLTLTVTTLKDQQKYLLTLLNQHSEWQSQYWVLPPFEKFDQGIEIRLNNHSYNSTASVSEVREIYLAPINSGAFAGLDESTNSQPVTNALSTQARNYWLYKTQLFGGERQTLILSQAFDPGWKAYLNGVELKEHVLVNNWANAWLLPEGASGEIEIIFWPQYLQFIGFGLLFFGLVWIVFFYCEPQLKDHTPVKHLFKKALDSFFG